MLRKGQMSLRDHLHQLHPFVGGVLQHLDADEAHGRGLAGVSGSLDADVVGVLALVEVGDPGCAVGGGADDELIETVLAAIVGDDADAGDFLDLL